MTSTSIRQPAALRPGEAPFGGNQDARSVAVPRGERASDQPLVVTDVGFIEAVGVGGIKEGDTRIERRAQHLQRDLFVAIGAGRQAHAAHRDRPIRCGRWPHVDWWSGRAPRRGAKSSPRFESDQNDICRPNRTKRPAMMEVGVSHAFVAATAPYVWLTVKGVPALKTLNTSAKPWILARSTLNVLPKRRSRRF